jgi:hypothetical protein
MTKRSMYAYQQEDDQGGHGRLTHRNPDNPWPQVEMRRLHGPYSREIRTEKAARAYAHVYDHYPGAGARSI